MSTTPNTQAAISASNLAAEYEQARLEAKRGTSRTKVASTKAQPAAQPHVELPATGMSDAVVLALMARLDKLEAENTALKAAKPASKAAPKSPITCKNCTWEHDTKTDELVIRVKLSADILDETGAPKVSSTGNSTGVAQLSGSLLDKNGRKVGLTLNAYHKL